MSSVHPFSIRLTMAAFGILASFIFSTLWVVENDKFWMSCYTSALVFSTLYLWTHRRNLISLSGLFVGISLIAITLPAVPYLVFELEARPGFHASIFLNSLGQIYFVTLALILSPSRSLYCLNSGMFVGQSWDRFVHINRIICLSTLPMVLIVISVAGGWGYLFGDRSGSFDRVASMKGLGPLMLFSVINVMALFFWVLALWLKGQKWRAVLIATLVLFLNGFTGGRQNLIGFLFASLLFHVALNGYKNKVLLYAIAAGLCIIFMKVFRVAEDSGLDFPWYVMFFLQFAGDFDSLQNDSVLVEYTTDYGFFGFYHIWSNIMVYLPRDLFPWKPHDLGSLYLNTYLFPGIYLGSEGGTGLALGFQGVWYAAYGLSTLALGNLILSVALGWADRRIYRKIHQHAPSVFVVAYIFIMGQSIIIYRDGFYVFLNAGVYVGFYYVIYKFIRSMVKENAVIGAPRHLEAS